MATITEWSWNTEKVDTYPTHTDSNGNTKSDVVYNVHWRLTGTDGTYSSEIYGVESLSVEDLSSFTDFDNLTKANVESWIITAMGDDHVNSMKQLVQNAVNEKETPTSVTRIIEQ